MKQIPASLDRKNMVCVASKRGQETYFKSCISWLARQNSTKAQFYRHGIMNTSIAKSDGQFPMLDAHVIASNIANNLSKDLVATYYLVEINNAHYPIPSMTHF